MEMSPKDYIVESFNVCFACIGDNGNDPYFVLGDSFLRGFYSIHDYENSKFGFAPHSGSSKAAPVLGTRPSEVL